MVHGTLRSAVALQELYHSFKETGETLFGNWFFQSGGFHNFVKFVHTHSQLVSKPPKKIASAVGNVRGQRPISGLAVTCVSNVGTERSCPSVPVCLRADAMCERMPGAYNVLVREPLVSSRKRWPCKLTLIDQKHIPVPINGTGKRNSRNGCGRFWLANAKKRVCRSRCSARTTHLWLLCLAFLVLSCTSGHNSWRRTAAVLSPWNWSATASLTNSSKNGSTNFAQLIPRARSGRRGST